MSIFGKQIFVHVGEKGGVVAAVGVVNFYTAGALGIAQSLASLQLILLLFCLKFKGASFHTGVRSYPALQLLFGKVCI